MALNWIALNGIRFVKKFKLLSKDGSCGVLLWIIIYVIGAGVPVYSPTQYVF